MKKRTVIVFLLLAAGAILFFHAQKFGDVKGLKISGEEKTEAGLQITFLDIGQGDATYIKFPDGTDMLVDCAKDARILSALGRVMSAFDRRIDYLVPTHPDLDHYGGCIDVLDRYDVGQIAYTEYEKEGNSERYRLFREAVDNERAEFHQIKAREVWTMSSTTVEFLYPDHDVAMDADIPDGESDDKKDESNNTSIVMKISYGEKSVLLTGDMPIPLENYLLSAYGGVLDVDILKVGHHGSSGSSGQEFLDVVSPEHAVISAGADNSYGHPTPRVLKRLERAKSKVWRTDLDGDVVFWISSEGGLSGVD